MRFESLVGRWDRGEIGQAEAAEMLGVSVRTLQRWIDRFEEAGAEGLADRRLGRPSPQRAPAEELERMLGLFKDKYSDFTVKHFHEQLVQRHNYMLGYTVTKLALQAAGLVRRAPGRSKHRKKRPRRPLRGMLLHQDGSRHGWLEGQPGLDLIVTLDDATSEVLSLFLVEEEGTASTFRGLREVVGEHGLFVALYTDRGSHYFETPKAGEKVSKTQLTQVGRALKQLGIEHIAAYSPQARGRSEAVPHASGPTSQGAAAGWHQHDRGGERLAQDALHGGAQPAICDRAGGGRHSLRCRSGGSVARHPVRDRGAGGGQRQHGCLGWPAAATAREPAAPALRAGQGAGARLSRRGGRDRSGTAPAGALHQPRRAHPRRPDRRQSGSGLGAVKAWPASGGASLEVGATASLDRASTRRPCRGAGRDGETGIRSNKETDRPSTCCLTDAGPGRPSFRPDHPTTKKLTVDELQKDDNFTR